MKPKMHIVSGHVGIYTAIYLEEFAAVTGRTKSKILAAMIEHWRDSSNLEQDIFNATAHAGTLRNIQSGALKCLDDKFGKGKWQPWPRGDIEAPEPSEYWDKVRLFAARSLAGRLAEYYPESLPQEPARMVADAPSSYGHPKSSAAKQQRQSQSRHHRDERSA